jgi:hypothetical protein
VIGTSVGASKDNGIGTPEAGTLEAKLNALAKPAVIIPTQGGDFHGLPTRTGSTKNPTYVPLDAGAATRFDWLLHVADTAYNKGGPPLDAWDAKPSEKDAEK